MTGKNNAPIEKGRVYIYIYLDVHVEILQPEDSKPSVKTRSETNTTALTPM